MNRRSFLLGAATLPLGAASPAVPVLDTHIHLFDPKRPEGVPWPPKTDPVLYQQALPDRYSKIAVPLGIVGAIKVEASPWLEDNQWVLDVIAKSPLIVGMVGNLEAGKPDFRKHFDRFHKNPLFLGIRCGNLWGRNFAADLSNPALFADLKTLSEAGLTLDIANLNPELLAAIQRVNDRLPDLRIVIDHLPQMQQQADLRNFAARKTVFVKLSEVYRRIDGNVPRELSVYRPKLDQIYSAFGEDRVLFGSDWPNSDSWRPYSDVLGLAQEYFEGKPRGAAEKFFWKNSIAAYRWMPRAATQQLGGYRG